MKKRMLGLTLDPKLKVTQRYYNNLDNEIIMIAKKMLDIKHNPLNQRDFRLVADYALATLYNNWESLKNRGYSLLHEYCWKHWYGDKKEVIDVYGFKIKYDEFGSSPGMWNVDHIWPYSKGGITVIENGMPISYEANEKKSDSILGKINHLNFEVERIETKQGYIGNLFINEKKIEPYKKPIL